VLVGQLELRDKLKLPEMRQVDQRVSLHCTLEPLGCEGVAGYIDHRLYAAGGTPDRIKFSDEAVETVYRLSGGIPRIINRLCDRALQHGYLQRVGTIDRAIINAQASDVPAPRADTPRTYLPRRGAAPAASAAAAAPVAPPPSRDALDMWLAGLDDSQSAPRVSAQPLAAAPDVIRPERAAATPLPAVDAASPRPRPGFVLRPQVPRTAIQNVTDRWLRRLGVVTFAVLAVGGTLLGAPAMIDIANALAKASTNVVAAPDVSPVPPAPSLKLAPAIALPATPDITADLPVVAGETTPH